LWGGDGGAAVFAFCGLLRLVQCYFVVVTCGLCFCGFVDAFAYGDGVQGLALWTLHFQGGFFCDVFGSEYFVCENVFWDHWRFSSLHAGLLLTDLAFRRLF